MYLFISCIFILCFNHFSVVGTFFHSFALSVENIYSNNCYSFFSANENGFMIYGQYFSSVIVRVIMMMASCICCNDSLLGCEFDFCGRFCRVLNLSFFSFLITGFRILPPAAGKSLLHPFNKQGRPGFRKGWSEQTSKGFCCLL